MISPIYHKISEELKDYIEKNGITGKLPGTRLLCREMGCHHVTLSKAIHLLEQQHILTVRKNQGIFVCKPEKIQRTKYRVLALVDSYAENNDSRKMLGQINRFLADYDYRMIGITFDESLFRENIQLLLNFPVDGFLFRLSCLRNQQAELLRINNIPVVSCARKYGLDWLEQMDCDHETGYSLLLDKLLSAGHQRIAWIEFDRIPEYRPYLNNIHRYFKMKLGNLYDPDLFFVREDSLSCMAQYGSDFLSIYVKSALIYWFRLLDPPTAIIVPHMEMFKTLCNILQKMNLRIPEDISVFYVYHGGDMSMLENPFSGVFFDEYKILFRGVRKLLDKVESPDSRSELYLESPVWVERGMISQERRFLEDFDVGNS